MVTSEPKLTDLTIYHNKILELASKNKNSVEIPDYNRQTELKNPLCGDLVSIRLNLQNNNIHDLSAKVKGCALCEASAGLLVDLYKKKNLPITNFMPVFESWLSKEEEKFPSILPKELEIFLPIQGIKNRHTCIKMPFRALFKLLD